MQQERFRTPHYVKTSNLLLEILPKIPTKFKTKWKAVYILREDATRIHFHSREREVNKWDNLNGHLARNDQTFTSPIWKCPFVWKPQQPWWCQGGRSPGAASRQEMTLSPGLPLFHEDGSWPGLGATWDPGQCSGVGPSIPC